MTSTFPQHHLFSWHTTVSREKKNETLLLTCFHFIQLTPLIAWCISLKYNPHLYIYHEPFFLIYLAMINAMQAGQQCFLALKTQTLQRLWLSFFTTPLSWLAYFLPHLFNHHGALSWLLLYFINLFSLSLDLYAYKHLLDFPNRFAKILNASVLGLLIAFIIFYSL